MLSHSLRNPSYPRKHLSHPSLPSLDEKRMLGAKGGLKHRARIVQSLLSAMNLWTSLSSSTHKPPPFLVCLHLFLWFRSLNPGWTRPTLACVGKDRARPSQSSIRLTFSELLVVH
eukprot:scaffold5_cov331-Pavlova_lutheri.AAC.55